MTRKNQDAATGSKPEEAVVAQDAEGEFMYSEINISGIPSLAALKPQFDQAFTFFRRGNQVKALKLMDDLVSKYKNTPQSALTLHVFASLFSKVASTIEGVSSKKWSLDKALDFAKRAAGMSPNSMDFSLFYAYLLFESANDDGVYEEVVKECERALSIEKPVDLGGENSQPDHGVQSKLRRLLLKSTLALQRKEAEAGVSAPPTQQSENSLDEQELIQDGYSVRGKPTADYESLNSEQKRNLLRINFSQLKEFVLSKDQESTEILDKAIYAQEIYSTWNTWICTRCEQICGTSEKFILHFKEHLPCYVPELECILPKPEVESIEGLANCPPWVPLDFKSPSEASNERKRGELIKEIRCFFEYFHRHKSLSKNLVDKVRSFGMEELGSIPSYFNDAFDHNRFMYICYLGSMELCRIKNFLNQIAENCEFESELMFMEKRMGEQAAVKDQENIRLVRDSRGDKVLMVDETTLPCKINDVSTAPNASHVVFENGVILDSDALLSWIYTGASSSLSAQLASWKRVMDPTPRIISLMKFMDSESIRITRACSTNSQLASVERELISVRQLYGEEYEKDGCYFEEFLEKKFDPFSTNILMLVKCIKTGTVTLEEAYGGIISYHNTWTENEQRYVADLDVEAAILKKRHDTATEMLVNETLTLWRFAEIEKSLNELASESCYNFVGVLLTLIKLFLKEYVGNTSTKEATDDVSNQSDIYGTGLRNEVGEFNCFLNVIIQTLWHLKLFRKGFLEESLSHHNHIGQPCVICELGGIFSAMTMENRTSGAVAPTPLRVAVSNLHPGRSLFKVGQMNDASELLVEILNCLHQSSDPPCMILHQSSDPTCVNVVECLAHSILGLNLNRKTHCEICKSVLPVSSFASYFHLTNATALRESKAHHPDESFEERLKRDTMEITRYCCQPKSGGCGGMSFTEVHIASSPPHVFTVVMGWQSIRETAKDIKDTIDLVSTEIDVGVVYHIDGLALSSRYYLVSVVCYEGMHYICFVYDHDHAQWMLYNDQSVKVIGSCKDVVAVCVRRTLQPQVLFYEAAQTK